MQRKCRWLGFSSFSKRALAHLQGIRCSSRSRRCMPREKRTATWPGDHIVQVNGVFNDITALMEDGRPDWIVSCVAMRSMRGDACVFRAAHHHYEDWSVAGVTPAAFAWIFRCTRMHTHAHICRGLAQEARCPCRHGRQSRPVILHCQTASPQLQVGRKDGAGVSLLILFLLFSSFFLMHHTKACPFGLVRAGKTGANTSGAPLDLARQVWALPFAP